LTGRVSSQLVQMDADAAAVHLAAHRLSGRSPLLQPVGRLLDHGALALGR
jgi:hypothetical protein